MRRDVIDEGTTVPVPVTVAPSTCSGENNYYRSTKLVGVK